MVSRTATRAAASVESSEEEDVCEVVLEEPHLQKDFERPIRGVKQPAVGIRVAHPRLVQRADVD